MANENGRPLTGPKPTELATCVVCGGFAPFLCDYEVAPGKTCDRPICGRCRVNFGLTDYCPQHAGRPAKVYAGG